MRVNDAIVFVSDMKRSVAFYREVVVEDPRHVPPGRGRPGLSVPDLDCVRLAQYLDPDGLGISVAEERRS